MPLQKIVKPLANAPDIEVLKPHYSPLQAKQWHSQNSLSLTLSILSIWVVDAADHHPAVASSSPASHPPQ
ncbi:hypothetical protein GQ457_12G030310 [Hibiscus cannabinus]